MVIMIVVQAILSLQFQNCWISHIDSGVWDFGVATNCESIHCSAPSFMLS